MSQSKNESAGLDPEDLVEDRELRNSEDDRLAHEGIVGQLASLIESVPTPSNIALYGPWGSGKSGIANLLESQLQCKRDIRFVRFDAFKYADVPLRRNFISAVASSLKCNNSKYHADLYSGRTRTDISVPPATVAKVLCVFALLMAGLTLILGIIVAIVAGIQEGAYWTQFGSLSEQALTAGLLPASLLAALIALASKTFSVDRSLAKPESDEQFEQLFRSLVSDSGAERLVVFVDELDRCSAGEVVATLDTVRTFLGISRCVFIIAADQTVLEEALTRAARQETPPNEANPYYSTGSAYLDKVFQYQISLPPLLTQSVSKFANNLVENRGGVWSEIKTEYIISVLVPSHVSSPRRVKHLLNTFVLTYRLAEERHRTGLLSEEPRVCAAAIARLVCLRVEFPLFARDLEVEPDLPNLVVQLMQDENVNFSDNVSERAQQLAYSYALAGAPPATVLSSGDDDAVTDGEKSESERGEAEEGNTGAIEATSTIRAHNKQLLNYLRRTRQVRGPSRNLIFMQSSGVVFGLDGELARSIEQAAEDEDFDTLERRFTASSEAEQDGILELLAQQIRTGSGLAAPNTARSFLLLHEAVPGLRIDLVVDSVVEAICGLQDDNEGVLDGRTGASAWSLARACSEASASDLRSRVVDATLSPSTKASAEFLVRDALVAVEAAPPEMSNYLASSLVSDSGISTLGLLFEAPDNELVQLLDLLRDAVAKSIADSIVTHKTWTERQNEIAPSSTRPGTGEASALAPENEPHDPAGLLSAVVQESGTRETPVQHQVLHLLLDINAQEARDAAEALIRLSEPTAQPALANAILKATVRRATESWPKWLETVEDRAIRPLHSGSISRLVETLWSRQSSSDGTSDALDALRPLLAALPESRRPDLTSSVVEELKPFVSSSEEASKRRQLLDCADLFASSGLVDSSFVAEAVISTLEDTLAEALSPVDRDDALYRYIMVNGAAALAAQADSLSDSKLNGIVNEATVSPWLDDLGHIEIPLELAKHAGRPSTVIDSLPTVETIANIIGETGDKAVNAATLWVDLMKPDPDHLATILDELVAANAVTQEFVSTSLQTELLWTTVQRRAMLTRYLGQPDSLLPDDLTLQAIGIAQTDDKVVAELLCGRFSQTTNNKQRQTVVDLWSKADIQDSAARKELIEKVIFGLLELHSASSRNVGAVELALNALDGLGKPLPYGVKRALGERVKVAVSGFEDLESRALRVLPRLGYRTRSSGLFGSTKRVDFTSG